MPIIIIPARLSSTRLHEKALADLHGKPMIERVRERALQVNGVERVVVATDSPRIQKAVESFGGEALLTPESLRSGTERVAFAARALESDIYVNVQGDEPLLDPKAVEASLELVRSGRFPMATPAACLASPEDLANPNVVKALVATDGRAVYFSRFPVPYSRGPAPALPDPRPATPLHHLGVYVYTRETLLRFASLEPCPWEAAESLEQLRALYHGIPIGVARAERASRGVDTPEDLELVRRAMLA